MQRAIPANFKVIDNRMDGGILERRRRNTAAGTRTFTRRSLLS